MAEENLSLDDIQFQEIGPKVLNLTGQKNGKLTALGLAYKQNGRNSWYCQCTCNRIKVLKAGMFRFVFSCGDYKCRDLPVEDLSGKTYNSLLVLRLLLERDPGGRVLHECLCLLCNKTKFNVRSDHLKALKIVSCGCRFREENRKRLTKHGLHSHPLYPVWNRIRIRCLNTKSDSYPYYGGRGIKMFEEWVDSPGLFIDYILGTYPDAISLVRDQKLQIDRIDVNGNYEPGNIRLASLQVQANNKRRTIMVKYDGKLEPFSLLYDTIEPRPTIAKNYAQKLIQKGHPIEVAFYKGKYGR